MEEGVRREATGIRKISLGLNFSLSIARPPLRTQPHQLRRVIFEHRLDLLRRTPEAEQSTNENPHAVDRVHMEHLPEVAADDAALWSDRFNCPDRLHRVGYRLVETRDHRLAVSANVDPEIGKP